MTIEQYLNGKADFNLQEETIQAILFDRGIAEGEDMTNVTAMQRDLATADLYMFLASSSTSASGDYESDGGWQRQRSSKNVYDRNGLRALAKYLYAKWGVVVPDTVGIIKMKPIY
jgi:hypothetical protein